jgi:hypothetical protein
VVGVGASFLDCNEFIKACISLSFSFGDKLYFYLKLLNSFVRFVGSVLSIFYPAFFILFFKSITD